MVREGDEMHTAEQLKLLFEEVSRNPTLSDHSIYNENWRVLSEMLNSLNGPSKTVKQWQSVVLAWQNATQQVRMNVQKDCKGNENLDEAAMHKLEKMVVKTVVKRRKRARSSKQIMNMNENLADPTGIFIKPVKSDENVSPCDSTTKSVDVQVNVSDDGSEFMSSSKDITVVQEMDDIGPNKKRFTIYYKSSDGQPLNDLHLSTLREVRQDLESHITYVQDRIHLIKDMWKHRCGDN